MSTFLTIWGLFVVAVVDLLLLSHNCLFHGFFFVVFLLFFRTVAIFLFTVPVFVILSTVAVFVILSTVAVFVILSTVAVFCFQAVFFGTVGFLLVFRFVCRTHFVGPKKKINEKRAQDSRTLQFFFSRKEGLELPAGIPRRVANVTDVNAVSSHVPTRRIFVSAKCRLPSLSKRW